MLRTLASLFGLDRFFAKKEASKKVITLAHASREDLPYNEGVRVYTRSGKYFFDFEPIVSTKPSPRAAATEYVVRFEGVKAFKATIAGCYRKHHGMTKKIIVNALWARNALYDWDKDNNTYVSKIICGITHDMDTATLLRLSFSDRGDDYAVDFHLADWPME